MAAYLARESSTAHEADLLPVRRRICELLPALGTPCTRWRRSRTVRYPGREDRLLESPARTMDELTAPLARAIAAEAGGVPVALFGHSMGALVAYETALRLQAAGGPQVAALLVSGYSGPERRPPRSLADAQDNELMDELVQLGGMDAEAFTHAELRDLVLSAVRSDYRLLENHVAPVVRPVNAPLTAYYGRQDTALGPDLVSAWSEATRISFTNRAFEGGHFYLVEHARDLVADVLGRLGV
ncbi:thioesterase II family protein [Streptomyces cadmiisoli]|uniref:Thioesterase n=1 Tax=Streptomyces cadmiisoli TaxID=2184053 RepID=A0A2Z4JET7_9ACTN|nr:alpha/beta fold hydrolase [Streptomyces cadmiisoli]AWW43511.1 thioesterase [Streptomyces cadmiisoli]